MLELRAATLGYRGSTVLRAIDLTVREGERVVVLGPSGAGKTTLLTALYRAAGASAALIPQPHGLVGPLDVRQNIALGCIDRQSLWGNLRSLCWMPPRQAAEIRGWARPLDLDEQLRQSVDTLSGGQQSRVAIARALYRGGPLLLADEPCAALDQDRARTAIAQLRQRFPTLICAMHDVAAGLALATRVIGVARQGIAFDLPAGQASDRLLDELYATATNAPSRPARDEVLSIPRGCS